MKYMFEFFRSKARLSWSQAAFSTLSFSQEGEDIILDKIFQDINKGSDYKGFFVDIGAHHPLRFSNTYKFYQNGWRGINVDPLPGIKKAFDKVRSRDINLELGISSVNSYLNYYMFRESAFNTFDLKTMEIVSQNHSELIEVKKIKTSSLGTILDQHLPKNQSVDFFSIDVEGLDFEVLSSNNWDRYTPKVIVVEQRSQRIDPSIFNSSVFLLLEKKEFYLYSKLCNSMIFVNKSIKL
jgi:FkbM family methyltransferase